ncbi:TetR family transcriptional regulator [Planotetraspora thailandica]|uniref:TetR family transcriptional regulator n=1 Tax=Planotetraspora thailandica TaxID=487172 RepID=A0A8J3V894_9ACTN|nr:TetR/AcrR family transcriptional regulator C-terminal domain-containing protein [Planotetraspora thailandica]GII51855.1 TetR family transcriptional regulator [Planotetraspora thailandica]
MNVFAGQGDAARVMTLLWASPEHDGEHPAPGPKAAARPGPKQGLSVDVIVRTAIQIADEGGITALSMRSVGERLGRSSMALYTYIPGKGELLDLMYDTAHAELDSGHDPAGGWRAAITSWAYRLRAFYLRHPWVLQVSYARPVLGPHEQAVLETVLRLLDEARLPAPTLRSVVSALFHFIRGTAQTAAESRQAAEATGTTDQEWWSGRAALLAAVAPDFAERFPHSVRLSRSGQSGDTSPERFEMEADDAFAEGLDLLLDGVEAARARAAVSDR